MKIIQSVIVIPRNPEAASLFGMQTHASEAVSGKRTKSTSIKRFLQVRDRMSKRTAICPRGPRICKDDPDFFWAMAATYRSIGVRETLDQLLAMLQSL